MIPGRPLLLVALLTLGLAATGEGASQDLKKAEVADEPLRQELLRRVKEDQAVRTEFMEWVNKQGARPDKAGKYHAPMAVKMGEIDRKNAAWLKGVIDKQGWPGATRVGQDGANAAWLLVQHADHDRAFQKRCLGLLREAVQKGEATGQQLAYLTDRVLVGEGKKQVYGTQLQTVDGKLVPQPIGDEAHVDQRRKEAGLMPLKDYLEFSQKMLGPRSNRK